MAYDLTKPLVIGISSRALFDLEEENQIFEQQGLAVYEAYQIEHENDILAKGSAFPLVKAFLDLNQLQEQRLVEVIIMSRNSPNNSLRIFNSIEAYGLDITRAALTGGAPIAPYLQPFKTDLFLSAHRPDVEQAINSGIAAGMILTGSHCGATDCQVSQIKIAFDGDAVLFAADSERIFQKSGLQAFTDHERSKANIPMEEGPFANFLKTIAHVQSQFKDRESSPIRTALVTSRSAPAHERENADVPMAEGPFAKFLKTIAHIQSQFTDRESAPIRTALVTSRNAPAHERAIKTLRQWGVRVDEAFFLGGVRKQEVLSAFGAHIFFDDQAAHAEPASKFVPAAVVPYAEGQDPMKK